MRSVSLSFVHSAIIGNSIKDIVKIDRHCIYSTPLILPCGHPTNKPISCGLALSESKLAPGNEHAPHLGVPIPSITQSAQGFDGDHLTPLKIRTCPSSKSY